MNVLLSKGGKEDSRVDKLFLFKYKRQSCQLKMTADEVKVNRLFGGCLPAVYLSRSLQTKLRGNSYDKIGEKVNRKAALFQKLVY